LSKTKQKQCFVAFHLIRCPEPPHVANTEVSGKGNEFSINSTVSYYCQCYGPVVITCMLVDGKGKWSDNPPTCELPTQSMCVQNTVMQIAK